jgi:hypothetical protein
MQPHAPVLSRRRLVGAGTFPKTSFLRIEGVHRYLACVGQPDHRVGIDFTVFTGGTGLGKDCRARANGALHENVGTTQCRIG